MKLAIPVIQKVLIPSKPPNRGDRPSNPQELESRDAERVADASNVIDRDISLAAFDGANKGPVDLSPVRELLLTD